MKKIRYKDLGGWMKVAVVLAFIYGVEFIISFFIGFFYALSY